MGLTIERWLVGAQAVNQVHLDMARLLTQVARWHFKALSFPARAVAPSTYSCATCHACQSTLISFF